MRAVNGSGRRRRRSWRFPEHATSGVAVVVVAVGMTACFATQDPVAAGLRVFGGPGFWKGLWDGIIAPLTFLVSLFNDSVRVYAIPNLGRWYDFGFMIGIGGFTHGAWRSGKRRLSRPERRDA